MASQTATPYPRLVDEAELAWAQSAGLLAVDPAGSGENQSKPRRL